MIDLTKPLEMLNGTSIIRIEVLENGDFKAYFSYDSKEVSAEYNRNGFYKPFQHLVDYPLHLRNKEDILRESKPTSIYLLMRKKNILEREIVKVNELINQYFENNNGFR